jgi:hypothetical protein
MKIEIFYSYACRDSYLVFAWLKLVEKSGKALDIHWRPFAIQMDDTKDDWEQPWERANSELRGFVAAEAAKKQGRKLFQQFHNALEQAVHEKFLELGDESTLIAAAQEAGLDMNRFREDLYDPQLASVAKHSHVQGNETLTISGTPTLVFPSGGAYHLELGDIPSQSDALETFRAIEFLVKTPPYIRQLRRTN